MALAIAFSEDKIADERRLPQFPRHSLRAPEQPNVQAAAQSQHDKTREIPRGQWPRRDSVVCHVTVRHMKSIESPHAAPDLSALRPDEQRPRSTRKARKQVPSCSPTRPLVDRLPKPEQACGSDRS